MKPDAPFPCWDAPSVSPSCAPQLQDDVSSPSANNASSARSQAGKDKRALESGPQEDQSNRQNRLLLRGGREETLRGGPQSSLEHQMKNTDTFNKGFDQAPSVGSTRCQSVKRFPTRSTPDTGNHHRFQTFCSTESNSDADHRENVRTSFSPKQFNPAFAFPQLLLISSTPSSPAKLELGTFPDVPKGLGVSNLSAVTGASELQRASEAQKQWQLHEHLPTFAKEMIAGGVAGAVAKTAVAPLERVKILFQTNLGDFARAGVGGSLRRIWRTEGPLGFLKGNGATVLRVVPYAALHFMTYEQYRRWLVEATGHSSPPVDLVAGSLSGATAVYFTYPLDLIRTRLAWHVSGPSSAGSAAKGAASVDNIRGVFLEIVQKEGGLRGLYKGIGPTLYGILPYAGLKFYIYEMMKLAIVRATDEQPSLVTKLGCGGVAGIIGQTLTYPLDVVRRQMQVQGAPADVAPRGLPSGLPAQQYKDTWDGLRTIVRKQGWRHLYAGLSINYLKMVPSVAIGFTVYEAMKAWLHVPPREKGSRTAVAVT
ncbi:mitochondrial substrate carrier family protein [Klebsormidium nitens]|uniref:Mitochondrial substrate carrier family protein n=1 Tax=Klebsormidium nitens TaxID=105231 RepID=A0A1Y1I4S9_KLENI|nr:mitochondrial substrate carrier family protein [Klebsormidium nitens]|eukprot:GAQ83727.1 mitochondrial substrate carrier family protein [Klebsormidium nitens]